MIRIYQLDQSVRSVGTVRTLGTTGTKWDKMGQNGTTGTRWDKMGQLGQDGTSATRGTRARGISGTTRKTGTPETPGKTGTPGIAGTSGTTGTAGTRCNLILSVSLGDMKRETLVTRLDKWDTLGNQGMNKIAFTVPLA